VFDACLALMLKKMLVLLDCIELLGKKICSYDLIWKELKFNVWGDPNENQLSLRNEM
jgi:hypothetical protein